MSQTYTRKDISVPRRFMPASQSLAVGMLSAVWHDLCMVLNGVANLMLEIWLEAVYTTSTLIQRLR